MALNATNIGLAILSSSPDLRGVTWSNIASAIGVGVYSWLPTITIQGVVTGSIGAGAVSGKMSFSPNALPVASSMQLSGIVGCTSLAIARGVGVGIGTALNASAQYTGVSAGVGFGSDVSKVVFADSSSLATSLIAAFTGYGLTGVEMSNLCVGLAPGISALLSTGVGVGVVTGPTGPLPGTGTSLSRIY